MNRLQLTLILRLILPAEDDMALISIIAADVQAERLRPDDALLPHRPQHMRIGPVANVSGADTHDPVLRAEDLPAAVDEEAGGEADVLGEAERRFGQDHVTDAEGFRGERAARGRVVHVADVPGRGGAVEGGGEGRGEVAAGAVALLARGAFGAGEPEVAGVCQLAFFMHAKPFRIGGKGIILTRFQYRPPAPPSAAASRPRSRRKRRRRR